MTEVRINGWELDEWIGDVDHDVASAVVERIEVIVGDKRPWVEACEPPGTGVVLGLVTHVDDDEGPEVRLCFASTAALRQWLGRVIADLRLEEWVEEAPLP